VVTSLSFKVNATSIFVHKYCTCTLALFYVDFFSEHKNWKSKTFTSSWTFFLWKNCKM